MPFTQQTCEMLILRQLPHAELHLLTLSKSFLQDSIHLSHYIIYLHQEFEEKEKYTLCIAVDGED